MKPFKRHNHLSRPRYFRVHCRHLMLIHTSHKPFARICNTRKDSRRKRHQPPFHHLEKHQNQSSLKGVYSTKISTLSPQLTIAHIETGRHGASPLHQLTHPFLNQPSLSDDLQVYLNLPSYSVPSPAQPSG